MELVTPEGCNTKWGSGERGLRGTALLRESIIPGLCVGACRMTVAVVLGLVCSDQLS